MSKLEIHLSDSQLSGLRRIAKPHGVEAEEFAERLIRDVLLHPDETYGPQVAVRAKTLAVQLRQDHAILLADFLEKLDLPLTARAVERPVRIDEYQNGVLTCLKDALESEIDGDPGEYLEFARGSARRDQNWLDGKEIPCPGCKRTLHWQLRSPFNDSLAIHCDKCPRTVEISYYDPVYEEIVDDVEWGEDDSEEVFRAELDRQIEGRLMACPCGGAFRLEAPQRCQHCSEPIPPQPGDVGEYYSREVFPSCDDHRLSAPLPGKDFWKPAAP